MFMASNFMGGYYYLSELYQMVISLYVCLVLGPCFLSVGKSLILTMSPYAFFVNVLLALCLTGRNAG